jgi:hypothetical protein
MRLSILLLHTVLASAIAIGASLMFGQSAVNLRWEFAFYGEGSRMTVGMLTSSAVTLLLAAAEVILATGWYLRRANAGIGLFALGMLLSLLYGDLIGALLAATSTVVLLEGRAERASPDR